jgi:hypothetical protein
VRSVLHDLAESGFVFQTGTQQDAVFRAATDEELGRMRQLKDGRIDELVWAIIYREGPITREGLGRIEGFTAANTSSKPRRMHELEEMDTLHAAHSARGVVHDGGDGKGQRDALRVPRG